MIISREVIEAKSRKLDAEWSFELEAPCKFHGQEIEDLFFIKYFVPWVKTPATALTIHDWALARMLSNEITKEIDKEILEALIAV